jgi:hypothetical protein
MKGKAVLIVVIAVVATAASTFVATRAITGTVQGGRTASSAAETNPGEIQSKGVEIATLVGDITESSDAEAVTRDDRDPMVAHRPKPKPKPPTHTEVTPSGPTWPSYVVTAVLIGDNDPRAFLKLGSESISVKVGDEIKGGRVALIEPDGVTIAGESGTKKYPF